MASLRSNVICILFFIAFPAIKSDDNDTLPHDTVCPADSEPDPASPEDRCVCVPARCPPPPTCDSPAVLERRPASGDPGDCCDNLTCVTPLTSHDRNCSEASCSATESCPEDSYSLRGGCQCLPTPCAVKACPGGSWPKVARPGTGQPGSCCPLYECVAKGSNSTCMDDGRVMPSGSSWFRADCTRCRCDGGLIFCDSATTPCSPLPPLCTRSSVPPGQCCPVCLSASAPDEVELTPAAGSCVTGLYGKVVANGTSWQEDDCTSCVCRDGQRQCQAYMCEACVNPQYEPGECCPRCNGSTVVTVPSHCPPLDHCSLRCVHGFVRDLKGCFTCHCQQDECLLDCPHGFAEDEHGNKLCKCASPRCAPLTGCRKRCEHGYRTNRAGCEVCRCDTCRPLDNCTKRCAHGLVLDARNCVVCKCIPHDEHHVSPYNTNNAVGTPCISDDDSGVWRDDGEVWFDGCRQCYCRAGREMCALLSCPPAPCATPTYNSSKDCCPSCPGTELRGVSASHMVCQGEVAGQVYKEGDTWQLSACVQCLCQSGRALCHAAPCPPTPCARPLPPAPGECCPVCPPDQLSNSSLSLSGTCERRRGQTMWREGNCVSCLCDQGRPSCFTELCQQQVTCSNALQVKNQCCPICLDEPSALESLCRVANETYGVGEGWREDECTSCTCVAGGRVSCTKLVCSVNCPNPVRKPGVCCHLCPEDKPREVVYVVILSVLGCAALCLALYVARLCRLRRHQLKLHSHSYGCPPPQYTQYKYMPTYDSAPHQPDKTAFTPL